jgi:heme/copper-type cytochrome/quinol oxidase subunit 3
MRITKLITATLVGTIIYLIVGWIVFEYLLGSYTNANTTQIVGFKKNEQESSMLMLILSCTAYTLLLSSLMLYWINTSFNLKEGFKLGAVVGILVATMTDTYWYGTSHFYNNVTPMILDIIAASITVGIMGGAIALVLSYLNNK